MLSLLFWLLTPPVHYYYPNHCCHHSHHHFITALFFHPFFSSLSCPVLSNHLWYRLPVDLLPPPLLLNFCWPLILTRRICHLLPHLLSSLLRLHGIVSTLIVPLLIRLAPPVDVCLPGSSVVAVLVSHSAPDDFGLSLVLPDPRPLLPLFLPLPLPKRLSRTVGLSLQPRCPHLKLLLLLPLEVCVPLKPLTDSVQIIGMWWLWLWMVMVIVWRVQEDIVFGSSGGVWEGLVGFLD